MTEFIQNQYFFENKHKKIARNSFQHNLPYGTRAQIMCSPGLCGNSHEGKTIENRCVSEPVCPSASVQLTAAAIALCRIVYGQEKRRKIRFYIETKAPQQL